MPARQSTASGLVPYWLGGCAWAGIYELELPIFGSDIISYKEVLYFVWNYDLHELF